MANFVFSEIPFSEPEIRTYGRGMEMWHGDLVNIPSDSSPQSAKNEYERSWFTWAELEPNKGQYNFEAELGRNIRRAIDAKRMYSFGVMSIYDNDGTNSSPRSGGYGMSYPLWLHNEMMSESVKPAHFGIWWVPNYNSNFHLDALDRFNQSLNSYLNNTTHNGVKLADAIYYIDIRSFGNWGEWHHYPFMDNMSSPEGSGGAWPVGMTPSMNTFRRIIDSYCNYLSQFQLVAMIAAFDCRWLNNTWNPPELASYIMGKVYGNGKRIGIRRDNWAEDGVSYVNDWWERNNRATLDGQPISYHLTERWKYAPVGGEPSSAGYPYSRLPGEVDFYHVSYMGNGNYYGGVDGTISANFRTASKKMGHRFVISGGSSPDTLTKQTNYTITLNWINRGNAPVYEDWDVTYELQNKTTNTVVWSAKSSINLRQLLPSSTPTVITDNIVAPSSVPNGSYRLVLKVKDPKNYKTPLDLFVRNRRSDGSYLLSETVNVTDGVNVTPVPTSTPVPTTTSSPTNTPIPTATLVPTSTPVPTSVGESTIFNGVDGNTETKNDDTPLTLGVKFRVNISGVIKKIRYWKPSQDTSVKIGAIWSEDGAILGEISFNNETSSGWQEATFLNPINVVPNTTYIAGYHSPSGNYTSTLDYFTQDIVSGNLIVPADGANGLYVYSTGIIFPTNTYKSSNYWIDVVFDTVSVTNTPVPTSTPVPTATNTPVPTSTPVPTATNTPIPTSTPVPTVTNTPSPTGTPINTQIMTIQTVFAGNNNLVLNNQPSTTTSLGNSNRYNTIMELNNFEKFKLVANVMVGSNSVNNPRIWVQYSKDNGVTWSNLSDVDSFISLKTVGVYDTPWNNIVDLAKTKVLIRVAQSGGNGTADPALGSVHIHYSQTYVDNRIDDAINKINTLITDVEEINTKLNEIGGVEYGTDVI